MPNPFIGSTRLNTGKPADDRPHAVEPRPEAVVGTNFPYRGMNDHGVPVEHVDPVSFAGYEDTQAGVYEPAEEIPDPIPVRVVREFTRELRRSRTAQFVVDGTGTSSALVQMIAGRNPARTSISVKNFGAQTVWIGESESVATFTGYPIAAGVEKVFNHEVAI